MFPQNLLWLVKGLAESRVHSLVGGALGLLLVFRTRSAYDRFTEARKMWSQMITALRAYSRMAHSSLSGWDRQHLLLLLAAFPPVLLHHLRSGRANPRPELSLAQQKSKLLDLLPASDVEIICNSRNRPMTVCRMMGAVVKAAHTDIDRILLNYPHAGEKGADLTRIEVNMIMSNVKADRSLSDKCIESLTANIGNCERIVKTSIPLAYSKHTSRFLSVWCFSLPLVLVEQLGWRMIPSVAVICWALLCIEEVGNIIEDPFNMPFLFKDQETGEYHDELKLERSFINIRGDVLDTSPAAAAFTADDGELGHGLEEEEDEMRNAGRGGNLAIPRGSDLFGDFTDYDVASFHRPRVYDKDIREGLVK